MLQGEVKFLPMITIEHKNFLSSTSIPMKLFFIAQSFTQTFTMHIIVMERVMRQFDEE